jgi:hypothetical protein
VVHEIRGRKATDFMYIPVSALHAPCIHPFSRIFKTASKIKKENERSVQIKNDVQQSAIEFFRDQFLGR